MEPPATALTTRLATAATYHRCHQVRTVEPTMRKVHGGAMSMHLRFNSHDSDLFGYDSDDEHYRYHLQPDLLDDGSADW